VGETTIEWAHWTLNPWRGCTKATWVDAAGKTRMHPGCEHCYAEKDMSVQLHGIKWGKGQARRPKAESGWKEPLRWARAAAAAGERHRVFCASLSDLLDNEGLPTMRERLWETIRKTAHIDTETACDGVHVAHRTHQPGLDWLLLTKRPENWRLIPEDVRPLVWLGTSVSDQETADEWVPRLLQAEGFRYRFLSVEPLLGSVDLRRWLMPFHDHDPMLRPTPRLDWVIVGGESGSKARPCNVEWVRSIVNQCRDAGIPAFCKQLGAVPVAGLEPTGNFRTHEGRRQLEMTGKMLDLNDPKGGDWDEWPEDLRVRQFPGEVS
jgi:protein gp37